jgi:NADH-quinone oxidoreductase subunit D
MLRTEEITINMGPQHPATHGVLRLELKLDGEEVVEAIPHIGYLHRGVEKIAENRTYQQVIPITDRLDYTSSLINNWAYVLTVEKMAKIPVPERAEYIRVIMCELTRINSHLVTMAVSGMDAGAFTMWFYGIRDREWIWDIFEMTFGARLTHNYIRFGGVSHDLPDGFVEKTREFCDYLEPKADEYENLLLNNYIFLERNRNVGSVSKEDAVSFGLTGPQLRASGVNWDIRKNDTYSIYDRFDFEIPLGTNGDNWDRAKVRLDEIRQSLRIIRQALNSIPAGEYRTPGLPRLLRPAPGEAYERIEGPRGEYGFYIVSDGSPKPYRWKFRSPGFSNLSVLGSVLKGTTVPDAALIIGSLDPCFAEVDR